ncbi:hypothetical protein ACPOL_2323 [Acidisarcina polymorpha]|uniref:Uncharacterized protein n=1 Tax=Acidisarcina polymorpha TaxID=2211140 RepID=A0A2Z5FYV5_9BACT|nr:hypothetical protein [Acidisarcina polymorpha]AXC11647.1 hypothetical protein ACPOL_2323 [Acidisarcina polymorpha]
MKLWQRIGLLTLAVLAVAGIRIFFIWRERNAPMALPPQHQERQLTSDDIVQPRKLLIDDLKSAKELIGKPVWVAAGYQLDYYPFVNQHVDYAHRTGLLPTTTQLQIEDLVTQNAPAKAVTRIPHGNEQVYAVFTLPGGAKKYATAIGYLDGTDSKFYCDDIFYYDDPHQMYKHWPPDVWQAIDQHQPKVGMNELQVSMALGQVQTSDSSNYGNRTVHYDVAGKQWTVNFDHNHATQVNQSQ